MILGVPWIGIVWPNLEPAFFANIILQPLFTYVLCQRSRTYRRKSAAIASHVLRRQHWLVQMLLIIIVEESVFHWWLPMYLPIWLCVTVFAVLHALTWSHFVQAASFSAIQIQIAEGSLVAACTSHAATNLAALYIVSYRARANGGSST